jgi:hypothetical protein
VDVRRTLIGIIHSPDTDEPDSGSSLRVIAPDRNLAHCAASDRLTLAAGGGRKNKLGFAGDVHDAIGLIKRVHCVRRSGLALAPAAMAGMNDQGWSCQTVPNLSARASPFHIQLHRKR